MQIKGGFCMKALNLKERIVGYIGKAAISVAKMEANSSCPYLSYQPKKPDAVKRLRKF